MIFTSSIAKQAKLEFHEAFTDQLRVYHIRSLAHYHNFVMIIFRFCSGEQYESLKLYFISGGLLQESTWSSLQY